METLIFIACLMAATLGILAALYGICRGTKPPGTHLELPLNQGSRGEIYCAGKLAPVKRSAVFFESMAEAAKEGKKALGHFLAKQAA
jgi:hypothetical protein